MKKKIVCVIATICVFMCSFSLCFAEEVLYSVGTKLTVRATTTVNITSTKSIELKSGDKIELSQDLYVGDLWAYFMYDGSEANIAVSDLDLNVAIAPKTEPDDNLGNGFDYSNIPSGEKIPGQILSPVQRIWNTILSLIRIAAFAGIIFAGVRYLYTSADQKADIKKSLVPLVIGMVLVFASTIVIQFLVTLFTQITNV